MKLSEASCEARPPISIERLFPSLPALFRALSYDHRGDPGDLDWRGEHVNVVNVTAHQGVVSRLHAMLLDYIQLYPVH